MINSISLQTRVRRKGGKQSTAAIRIDGKQSMYLRRLKFYRPERYAYTAYGPWKVYVLIYASRAILRSEWINDLNWWIHYMFISTFFFFFDFNINDQTLNSGVRISLISSAESKRTRIQNDSKTITLRTKSSTLDTNDRNFRVGWHFKLGTIHERWRAEWKNRRWY